MCILKLKTNKMKKLVIYLKSILIILIAVSCNNWLTIEPSDEVIKDKMFLSEQGFWDAINGTYTLLGKNHSPEGNYNAGFVDHLASIWSVGNKSTEYKLGRFQYKNADIEKKMSEMFLNEYNIIAHVNTILEYIEKADFLKNDIYKLIKAEALGIRAWSHLNLTRVWGPMPLNVKENERYLPYVKKVSKNMNSYTTHKEYMKLLLSDLDSAEILIKDIDPICRYSNSQLNKEGGLEEYKSIAYYWRQNRFNYYAILGTKARAYLWNNDKVQALKYATMVKDAINTDSIPKFRLGINSDIDLSKDNTNPNYNFFTEHLFSFARNHYNFEQIWPGIYTEPNKIQLLFDDTNDVRYKKWWKYDENNMFTMLKQQVKTPSYTPLIRLAEIYMVIIECGDLSTANEAYKEFCKSRDANYKEITEGNRLDIVMDEYYKEFIAEGEIFFINKRYGIKKMKWAIDYSYEPQYVLPKPLRETEIFN